MKSYPATPRVNKLRETALNESLVHPLPLLNERIEYNRDDRYGWDDRMLMWFYEAWEDQYKQPTTLLRRYTAEADMIARMPVFIFDDDLICGRSDMRPLNESERERFETLRMKNVTVSPQVLGRTGHMSLDYGKLLKLGIEGILSEIDEAEARIKGTPEECLEKEEFYLSARRQLKALLTLEDRYVAAARERGLNQLADIINRVPRLPARTFHEALQSMHFYSFVLRDLFSCGHPDQFLIDYYRADIKAGSLTEEKALELIDCFNIQYTFYTRKEAAISIMLGGRDGEGNTVGNELTWLFLQSITHVNMAYPSVGLAVTKDIDPDIFNYALELISKGYTHPALFNQEAIEESLVKRGIADERARLFVHSTCVEITPCNCSGFWATSPYHNCAQILIDLLAKKRDFNDIESLMRAFSDALTAEVKRGQREQDYLQLERRRNGGESPLASCLVDDCIARGKNIDQGGAIYNHVLPNFIAMSNVIDSFAAIDTMVFKEKKLTLDEYWNILCKDYEGSEALRQYIVNRCPHFGNNETYTDDIGKRVYDMAIRACEGFTTLRGGHVYPGAFSFYMHMEMGKTTMATPDGRHAGEAFNGGSDPVSGRDVNGPTASLLSTTEWPHDCFPGGIAVNMSLNLQNMDERKRENAKRLVRAFMDRGGFEMQINCIDAKTLEKAMERPEDYQNLLVRIGGYSDYFVRQTPELQREIIARTCHEV